MTPDTCPPAAKALPSRVTAFVDNHPVLVRLYTPAIVTATLAVELLTRNGGCTC